MNGENEIRYTGRKPRPDEVVLGITGMTFGELVGAIIENRDGKFDTLYYGGSQK